MTSRRSAVYRQQERTEKKKYQPHVKAKKAPVSASKPEPVKIKKESLRPGQAFRYVVIFVMISCVCLGLLSLKAQISGVQLSINNKENEIKQLQRQNSDLQEQVYESQNINLIIERAKSLGMTSPTDDQLRYVNLPNDPNTQVSMKLGD